MLKTTFYTTLENQVRNYGSNGLLFDHFEDLNVALAKYNCGCTSYQTSTRGSEAV